MSGFGKFLKMPTIDDILTFISILNFMLSWAVHEKVHEPHTFTTRKVNLTKQDNFLTSYLWHKCRNPLAIAWHSPIFFSSNGYCFSYLTSTFGKCDCEYLSHDMRFPTMWYVRPAKAQTSLRIQAGWSEPLLVAWIFYYC